MVRTTHATLIQRAFLAFIILSLLSLFPQSDVSAAYDQQSQLLPSDPAAANEMGYAVDMQNMIAVVGVPGDADRGANSGSAYIFRRDSAAANWYKEAKLTAPDATPGDRYGSVVSTNDTYVVVSAPNWGSGQGAVYVYERKGGESWPLQAILTADDGAAGDEFGASIHYGGGTPTTVSRIVVGAPGKGAGAVYLFELDSNDPVPTWHQVNKLTPSDGAAGDRFGSSVYTNRLTVGDFTIIGAPNDDDAGTDSGSVYVYNLTGPNTWSQETKLNGSDSVASDHFGQSMASAYSSSNGVVMIAGAPDADAGVMADTGAVYSFKRDTFGMWSQETKMTASDAAASDHFGADVDAYIDRYAIIGSPGDDDKGADAGAAYVFTYAEASTPYNWEEAKKITGTESAAGDHYGAGVTIDEDVALIGAPLETGDTGQAESGAVHIHRKLTSNWGQYTRLLANNSMAGGDFGSSFAIDGNYAIVGAVGDADGGTSAGAAYIFFKSGAVWSQQARLTASDNGRNTQFGNRVAINGNTALVSAVTVDGSVLYVYVRNGSQWTQQARLISPSGPSGHIGGTLAINGDQMFTSGDGQRYFYTRTGSNWALQDSFSGTLSSVAMDGNWAVIGNATGGIDGAVDVYHWGGSSWVLAKTLTPAADSSSSTMSYGFSVAISNTTIAIGAGGYSEPGKIAMGAVFRYSYDGANWNLQQILKRSGGLQGDGFGTSVSVEGSRIAAGMYAPLSGVDRAVIFRNIGGTWTQVQSLTRNTTFEDYGKTVALENNELWITVPLQGVNGDLNAGTVYGYQYTADADLAVELADIPGWIAGFDMTYEITVTNNGQENATGVSVVDTLPLNVTFLSASAGCTPAANVVTCAIGNLNIGASQTVSIDVNINGSATGTLTNQATVSSALPDPNTADNTATQQTQIVPAPDVPTPLSPTDGNSTTNTQPTFTWSSVSGITNYQVQLDIVDPPLAIYSGFNVGTTFKPPSPLLYMTYYWRVRSVDEFDIPSPWSETQVLIVNAADTVAPIHNVSNAAQPTLSWTPVTWATGYEVEIGADKNFMTVVYSSGTLPPSDTSYTSLDELPNGTWYWRVRALKADGVSWSLWSAVETIQIIAP